MGGYRFGCFFEEFPVGHRQHGDYKHYGTYGAKADDDAHGHPKGAAVDYHGDDSYRSSGTGEEDGPHAAAAGLERYLADGQAFGAQLFGIVEHDDGVAHIDAHKTHYANDGREADIGAEHPQPHKAAQQAEPRATQGEEGEPYFLEVEQQEEEHYGDGGNEADNDAAHVVLVDGVETAIGYGDALGQHVGELAFNPWAQFFHHHRLAASKPEVGTHGGTGYAVAVHYLGWLPVGADGGHLAQGHPHTGDGGWNNGVLQLVEIGGGKCCRLVAAGVLVQPERYLQGVVLLPHGGDGKPAKERGQIGREDSFGYPEA